FLWNISTLNFIDENKSWIFRITGFDVDNNISKFTTTTSLFFVHFAVVYFSGNCLFVCYLRSSLVYFHLKFSSKAVTNNVQVKFAHPTDNRLACIFICLYTEC